MFNRSRRVQTINPPPPIDPISNRPYGQPRPERDEAQEAAIAAGQSALANANVPAPVAVGYDPRRSAWKGTRD